MAWIGNKKAYNMVPQNSLTVCLKMYKISDNVIKIIEKTMEIWIVQVTAGGKHLAEVKFQ